MKKWIYCLCLMVSAGACAPANIRRDVSMPLTSGEAHRTSSDLTKVPIHIQQPALDIPPFPSRETQKENLSQDPMEGAPMNTQFRIAATRFADIKMKLDIDPDTIMPRSFPDIPQVLRDSNIILVFSFKPKEGM